ncbi:MAG: sigma-70 family RNA polymerase sigma factor [Planctomycetaceae bacterium]|nr:sigma-70 family RNA polymerase sigma factor [Planctomycetaceae bacterium]
MVEPPATHFRGCALKAEGQPSDRHRPLAQISTVWSVVIQARDGAGVSEEVLAQFFASYQGAVYRYFLSSTGRSDVAEDLTQDFALRFIRGDFRRVHPDSGRFRDFLRVALANQLRDYFRRQTLRKGEELPEQAQDPKHDAASSGEFDTHWRDELLAQTWIDLERHQKDSGQLYYSALKLKATETGQPSQELATLFSNQTETSISDTAFRKLLQRARERFGELLLQNVASTLSLQTREELERELMDLQLHAYCRTILDRTGSVLTDPKR